MATLLTSVALVPVLAGLYLPSPQPANAGLAASLAGLLTSVSSYTAVNLWGVYDANWETTVLTLPIGEQGLPFWQDHTILVALPISALAYAVAYLWERRARP